MERKKGFAYNHRNMALRYVFLARVQGVHIPAESLARLIFLGSKQSRQTSLNNESCDKEASVQRGTRRILAYKKRRKALKRYPKKEKRRCFRKRVSAKTAVFSVFKSIKSVDKSNDTLTARRRRALV